MKSLCVFFLLPLLLLPLPSSATSNKKSADPLVHVDGGTIRGINRAGLLIFKGIPYAQPPVGQLRWRPPQPVRTWTGVRSAAAFGHDCMQLPTPGDAAPLRTLPSEDCLYVNVWAPQESGGKSLPVMVWIYGGGFVDGGSSPAVYSGAAFARHGVVFVSFNYRLGRFGFFAFPALDRENSMEGNYAFMDQIAALRWVRENIAAFGGDPRQVTIFGESAGGMSVSVLLTSPLARGLFQRAIIESGGGRNNLLRPALLDRPGPRGERSAEQDGIAFARSMGVQGTDAAALAALRRLPAARIVHGLNMHSMFQQHDIYSGPMVDGKLMARPAEEIYRQGKQAPVPLVVGANSADIGFTSAHSLDQLFAPFGEQANAARAGFHAGPKANFDQIAQQVGQVEDMLEPARFVARRMAAIGQPAYQYRFSYIAAAMRKKLKGAPHSSEIPYVFDTIRESMWSDFGKGITAQDLQVARQVNAYWINFVKTGDPNGSGLPHWPKIAADGDQLMNFTLHGPAAETDPWKEQLDLVEKVQP